MNEIPPLIKFTVNNAGVYVFETMNSSYLTYFDFTASNTKLVLYNTSFSILAQNDDISSTNNFSRIETTLQTGYYYLALVNQDLNNIAVNCYLILERFDTGEDTTFSVNGELAGEYNYYANSMYDFYKIGNSSATNLCLSYARGDHAYGTDAYQHWESHYEGDITVDDVLPEYTIQYNTLPSTVKNCIIAYGKDYTATHYAKMVNGIVTAKIGRLEIVQHTSYNAYFSADYGNKIKFFVKP